LLVANFAENKFSLYLNFKT